MNKINLIEDRRDRELRRAQTTYAMVMFLVAFMCAISMFV